MLHTRGLCGAADGPWGFVLARCKSHFSFAVIKYDDQGNLQKVVLGSQFERLRVHHHGDGSMAAG